MTAASARATYQDVLDAPTEVIAQVIDGTLYTTPRPGVLHAGVSSALGVHLGAPYQFGAGDGPGGWIFLDEAELHLGDDIVVPDLAGWRRERLPQLPAAPFLTLAPDWLCEVLSPSTQAIDRVRKMEVYRLAQVPHVWLLDPRAQTLEAYQRQAQSWVRTQSLCGNTSARIAPFEATVLDLGALWAR